MNDPIRFAKHIAPHIGALAVTSVKSSHVRDVLDQGKEQGKSRKSLVHLRRVMNLIFASLWQDEVIPENSVARVKAPNVLTDKRERAVLTDAELVSYLGWQHPEEHDGMAVLERQVMACISRCFGGLRTGDMARSGGSRSTPPRGAFRSGWAPRKKTARPQLLEIPAMLRPLIRDWWERAGRPATDLLFSARRGQNAGVDPKLGVSEAPELLVGELSSHGLLPTQARRAIRQSASLDVVRLLLTALLRRTLDHHEASLAPVRCASPTSRGGEESFV